MLSGSRSQRDIENQREFRAYTENEELKARFAEDTEQYRIYRNEFDASQRRLPPAHQIEPLTFDSFRSMMPNEADPALRATQAIARSLWQQNAEIESAKVLSGRDSALLISPELDGAKMSKAEAQTFNKEQAARFRENTPEFYPCPENSKALVDYFDRNEVRIINEPMFKAAFERLRSFGVIRQAPEPEVQIEQQPEAIETQAAQSEVYVGIDPDTGRPHEYTQREIDKMTSYQFKRAFDLNQERRIAAWQEFWSSK